VEVFLLSTIISAPPVRANARTFIKRIRKTFRDGDPSFDQIRELPRFRVPLDGAKVILGWASVVPALRTTATGAYSPFPRVPAKVP
jgi:hypothetical protein